MLLRPKNPRIRSRGFSLVELVAVVGILALIGGLAVGSGSAVRDSKPEAGAAEIATALRWARQESRRSDDAFGVQIDTSPARVRVYRVPAPPAAPTPTYDVRHPISKKIWDQPFADRADTSGVTVAATLNFFAVCTTPIGALVFEDGDLTACTVPDTVRLDSADFTIADRGLAKRVSVDGLTGRVWVD